jgi:hypothetical protein
VQARKAWFSTAVLTDQTKHKLYNEYHQLDHQPENRALRGVIHGDRWVRTRACVDASTGDDPRFAATHYLVHYLFREPLDQSLQEWNELAVLSHQLGRFTANRYVTRPFRGFFVPVKTYRAAGVKLSDDAIPLAPSRGIYVSVSEVIGRDRGELEDVFAWYDETLIPTLLECRGATGAMSFVDDPGITRHPDGSELPARNLPLRIDLFYLEGDPLSFAAEVRARTPEWRVDGVSRDRASVDRTLFSGPMLTIRPWEWDWFEDMTDGKP